MRIPAVEVRNTRAGFFEEPESRTVSIPQTARAIVGLDQAKVARYNFRCEKARRCGYLLQTGIDDPAHVWKGVIMATNTIRLHRLLRATPERVYRAFLDADAMAKWLPPNGFTGKVHQMDARVGGTYKMSFTNFTTGHSHSFGGTYLELVPNEHIRHT